MDPLDRRKRDLEDADRTRALAKEARTILARLYPHWTEDWSFAVDALRDHGFSVPDACHVLEFIDFEDDAAEREPEYEHEDKLEKSSGYVGYRAPDNDD